MGKIIAVWGSDGSGKSTFAANLGCAIAAKGFLTGIISSNLIYGRLQTLFGEDIPEKKGLYPALCERNVPVKQMFCGTKYYRNLFILSLSNRHNATLIDGLGHEAETMLREAAAQFDYIITDCSEDLNNAVSTCALSLAHSILLVNRPSSASCLWYLTLKPVTEQLFITDKIIPILNGDDGSCDTESYLKTTGLNIKYELPFTELAPLYENAAIPIYCSNDKKCRDYCLNTERIVKAVIKDGAADE